MRPKVDIRCLSPPLYILGHTLSLNSFIQIGCQPVSSREPHISANLTVSASPPQPCRSYREVAASGFSLGSRIYILVLLPEHQMLY